MKKSILLGGIILLSVASCKKIVIPIKSEVIPKILTPQPVNQFVKYVIKKGQQYCVDNALMPAQYTELKFMVKFDSTAIYETATRENQNDINKLYGFSDNNAMHHEFSARFGWRWSNNALRLFGYVYNDSIRSSAEIGVIRPGTEYDCKIKVAGNQYIFSVDNKTLAMPRTSPTVSASGYKLLPYFGGDETAPHDINIWIKEY
jgi:hypothetical protein